MKQRLFIVIFLSLFSLTARGGNENFVQVGEWGSGYYQGIAVKNNYAYCYTDAGDIGIIDIIDISQPTQPVKVNQYGTPVGLLKRFVYGNYLYAVTDNNELLVLEISNPRDPNEVATFGKNQNITDVFVSGHYAYCIRDYNKLMILDIAEPAEIKEISHYQPQDYSIEGLYVSGNKAYLNCRRTLEILDLSNPAAPVLRGVYNYESYQDGDLSLDWYGTTHIDVKGGYAYLALEHEDPRSSYSSKVGLFIIDISNPAKPIRKAILNDFGLVRVSGDYAYDWDNKNLYMINISDPATPRLAGKYEHGASVKGLFVRDHYTYLAADDNGLLVVNTVNPTNPTLAGRFDESGQGNDVITQGDYAFMARRGSGLDILDISSPAAPVRVGNFAADYADTVELYGDYVYLADGDKGIWVINISNPASPFKTAQIPTLSFPRNLIVSGHYLYATDGHEVLVFDITVPSAPAPVTEFKKQELIHDFYISGNWLYLVGPKSLSIMDVSNPSVPIQAGNCNIGDLLYSVVVHGNYAYVSGMHTGLNAIDVRDPRNPFKVGQYDYSGNLYAEGNYLYLRGSHHSLQVFDISNPPVPRLVGWHQTHLDSTSVYKSGKHLYLTYGASGKLSILKFTEANNLAHLVLSRSYIHFAGTTAKGPHTSPQTVFISNPGKADLHWSISKEIPADEDWLSCTPTSGTNNGEITLTVNPAQLRHLCNCTYKATLVVSAPEAINSTKILDVDLRMWDAEETLEPFGEFATPRDGSVVSGTIPVTGWALDDLEVTSVGIYRKIKSGLVHIGDGSFIEGARPDVDEAYSWFPLNYRAGWGYMLLTDYLSDGPVTLCAIATDLEGNQVTLGTKTIRVDNKNAVKPFGTLDTPPQGGYASGRNYLNWGWAITPQPNTIPFDGSSITVWVDGIPLGHPVYNQYREDVATSFPAYNNSGGAVGYFYLDTTAFINGVHTIAWSVTDDAGNSEGIGSRFFMIANSGTNGKNQSHEAAPFNNTATHPGISLAELEKIPLDSTSSLEFVRGSHRQYKPGIAWADNHGLICVQIRQLERLEIHLNRMGVGLTGGVIGTSDWQKQRGIKANPGKIFTGGQVVGKQLRSLPIGSYLDPAVGIFYWQPCAGFVGTFRLVFICIDQNGTRLRKEVALAIAPR